MSKEEESSSSSSSNDKKEQNATSSTSTSTSTSSSWFGPLSSLKQQWEEFDDQQRINRLKSCQILDEILNNCRQKQKQQHSSQQQQQQQQQQQTNQQQDNDDIDPIESVSIGLRNMKYFGWRGILSSKKETETETKAQDEGDNDNDNANGCEVNENEKIQIQKQEKYDINNEELLSKLFHPKIRQSCSREQHAVWACRAVSTGCGKDLSQLKRCFEDIDTEKSNDNNKNNNNDNNNDNQLPPHYRILTAPYTNYEGIIEKTEEGESLSTTTTTVDNATSSSSSSSLSLKQRIPCYDIQRQLGSCVTINGKQLLERKQKREHKK